MARKLVLWTGLGILTIGSVLPVAADAHGDHDRTSSSAAMILADSGEGGEGGEGGGAGVDGDAAYLTSLGLVEGHMTVGMELYRLGAKAAAVHMKHPADELYADLVPAMEARGLPGFGAELEAMSIAVANGRPVAEVEALLAKLVKAIEVARSPVPDTATTVKIVQRLVRTAADEYAVGVKDGKVVNDKEYQDAWGFIAIARKTMAGISAAGRARYGEAIAQIEAELENVKPAWTEITGTQPVTADPALLAVAAAKIELAAYAIK